ncbi:hypothetical protein ATPR_2044 [Acetobacter tropicalis NBRC 101654]|uniref:Uncharacterized protein n=1 Tax=Acetobacter tropicalis NBRC 101654 TaxID=749388 RepID=F7VF94_9PROT|nr:hypothetical protein ATPR_2044 [Acetobacter tropicalis NBRC 101654]
MNPHGLRHQNLNLACLPIPPHPHGQNPVVSCEHLAQSVAHGKMPDAYLLS